jgi:hypothetical protein
MKNKIYRTVWTVPKYIVPSELFQNISYRLNCSKIYRTVWTLLKYIVPSALFQNISYRLNCSKIYRTVWTVPKYIVPSELFQNISYRLNCSKIVVDTTKHICMAGLIKHISSRSFGLHQLISYDSLYCVKYYLYLCIVCVRIVVLIICALFVGRGQSISCDNFLSNPIAVLFAIK